MLDAAVTLAEIAAVLAPVLGAIGGGAKWLASRSDKATEATEKRIAALEASRDAAQAAFVAFVEKSTAASESRTEKVVAAITASTAADDATRFAITELRHTLERVSQMSDGRTTSERIAGGSRDAVG